MGLSAIRVPGVPQRPCLRLKETKMVHDTFRPLHQSGLILYALKHCRSVYRALRVPVHSESLISSTQRNKKKEEIIIIIDISMTRGCNISKKNEESKFAQRASRMIRQRGRYRDRATILIQMFRASAALATPPLCLERMYPPSRWRCMFE